MDYLNDLGVILHFKDFKLKETHVLQPRWVTAAVYKIINSPILANCNGLLALKLLDDILKKEKKDDFEYPPDKHRYIIDLMKKFELCYEVDGDAILVPDLLEVPEPEFDFDYDNALKFIIQYDFLPPSVMPRFIVHLHKDIKDNLRWRTGVVLEDRAFRATALVRADEEAKKISIFVSGEQRRDYFAVLLFTLRQINGSFERLKAVEQIPLPDNPEVTVSYRHLIRLEQEGEQKCFPEAADRRYDVADLLGTIYIKNEDEDRLLQVLEKLMEKMQDISDNEETILKKMGAVFQLQPGIMGARVDVMNLLEKVLKRKSKKHKESRR